MNRALALPLAAATRIEGFEFARQLVVVESQIAEA